MRTKTDVSELPVRPETTPGPGAAHLATVVALLADGTLELHIDEDGPGVTARLAMPATRERIERAVATRQPAVVVFENGDPLKPLVVGFVEPLEPAAPEAPGSPVVQADVDGHRVTLTARDEIVLECGSASITLRRNGRVIIRGTYVETRSDGTNRIKGGQVQIN